MAIPEEIPQLGPKAEKPRLNPGADLTAHRLTPTEVFVLSRINGDFSYEQICQVSGIGVQETLEILRKLKRDGLLLGARDPMPKPDRMPAFTPIGLKPGAPDRASLLERLDDRSPVDPLDLVPGPDLAPEAKMRIIRVHRRLKKLGPHQLLGLDKTADRAEIKRAYFAASKELHPDRYFGRDIGAFRDKLGDIFARVTEAFQSLEKK